MGDVVPATQPTLDSGPSSIDRSRWGTTGDEYLQRAALIPAVESDSGVDGEYKAAVCREEAPVA